MRLFETEPFMHVSEAGERVPADHLRTNSASQWWRLPARIRPGSKKSTIYVYSSPYIYLIILDADFDEDSDSDLRLEIGAHLDLVFEG